MKNEINKKNWILDYAAIVLFIIFTAVGVIVSLHRFWQYEVFYIDFGQYDQAIWAVSRFQSPMVDHFVHGFIHVFADHFTPSVFLLVPLYWITSESEVILIAQAIAVGLSGLVLYSIGKTLLKDRFLSIAVVSIYYLFVGLQNAVITEFHELALMTPFFMFTFWAFVRNKRITYFIFLFLTLGFKEVAFLIGISLGIAIFLIEKKWRKLAIWTIIISILWGIIVFNFVIPYFSNGGKYLYTENLPDTFYSKLTALFDHPLKRHTLFYSFFSYGFLPIFSPQFWVLMLQDYLSRFETKYLSTRWDLGLHYNAVSAIILAVSTIYSIRFFLRFSFIKKYKYFFAWLIIVNALFLNRFVLNGPFNLVYNKAFYDHTKNFAFLDKMVKMIPSKATIATHNNLAAQFTHQRVWLLRENYDVNKPQYILIDDRKGQNPNNFTSSGSIKKILKALLRDPKYQVYYRTNDQYIFKRK